MSDQERRIQDLLDTGFIPETKIQYGIKESDQTRVPTGRYVLPGWEPEPAIELEERGYYGKIDRLGARMQTKSQLEFFIEKTVPAFCEELKL